MNRSLHRHRLFYVPFYTSLLIISYKIPQNNIKSKVFAALSGSFSTIKFYKTAENLI